MIAIRIGQGEPLVGVGAIFIALGYQYAKRGAIKSAHIASCEALLPSNTV
jgi:hypothetical protein